MLKNTPGATPICFALLCFALFCFTLFTLFCFVFHWFALLWLVFFALLCFAMPCCVFLFFVLLYVASLCFALLGFALLWLDLFYFVCLCFALLRFELARRLLFSSLWALRTLRCFVFLCFVLRLPEVLFPSPRSWGSLLCFAWSCMQGEEQRGFGSTVFVSLRFVRSPWWDQADMPSS